MTRIIIVIVAAAIILGGARWAFFPWAGGRRLPRHRVRHLRIRLRLRLHPGPGHATIFELWWRWGRLAAFRRSGRARRSLTFWQRAFGPASAYSILIGRAHLRHALRLPAEEHARVYAIPHLDQRVAPPKHIPPVVRQRRDHRVHNRHGRTQSAVVSVGRLRLRVRRERARR